MSNATKTLGTKNINAMITGNNPVQHNVINWSYFTLGKEALNHTNKNNINEVFIASTSDSKDKGANDCDIFDKKEGKR